MTHQNRGLRAVVIIALASLCGSAWAASTPDLPSVDQTDYLRLAVHHVDPWKMDEYRAAVEDLVVVMKEQGLTTPLNAYRGRSVVRMTEFGEQESPIAQYSFSTSSTP